MEKKEEKNDRPSSSSTGITAWADVRAVIDKKKKTTLGSILEILNNDLNKTSIRNLKMSKQNKKDFDTHG